MSRSVCIFFLFIPFSLFAQTWGKIAGMVRDGQTRQGLPGANIIVEGVELGTVSDSEGHYTILRVPPGRYTLQVRYIGYQTVTVKDVEVLTDLTTTIDVVLQPSAIMGEEVVIVAERPLIRKDLTSSEARVSADQIKTMPVQEIGDLLDLQAGVTRDVGGGLHIRGGRSSEIAYMVNGISITDDYVRGQALAVENESVQELQVVSGTFNAEYGNAMSGVINVVTKEGGNNFEAKLETWCGDYVTGHRRIFWNIDAISPLSDYNVQGTLSGPIVKDRATYFFTARRVNYEGWLYGPNAYLPQGRIQIVDGQSVSVRGDSTPVPMNFQKRWSGQGALKWKISGPLSFKMDFLGSRYESNGYNHFYRLNPHGRRNYYGYGITVIPKLVHFLGKNTFYEVTSSYKFNEDKSYLYKNPYDPRYVHPDSLTAGAYAFYKAGTDLFRSFRSTRTWIGKIDFTSQILQGHQIKTGLEYQKDRIHFEELTLVPATDENGQQIIPFRPAIEPVTTPNHSRFQRSPEKWAAYLQDKIEYEQMILNIGIRFDYFHSNGQVPVDPQDPNVYHPMKLEHIYKDLNGNGVIEIAEQREDNLYSLKERRKFWYRKARAKTQVSPRMGIAYPITDRGVIHFSYGLFQQVPEYSQLYAGDEIKLTEGQGIAGPFGNPDLNPQRTTLYELGLKQQLTDALGIDVTAYYRDIRDWVSTSPPIPTVSAGVSYSKRINRDFAYVRGLTFSLFQRFAHRFIFNFDYTYQEVQGTNSSPEDEYFAMTTGAEPKKQLSPLDWDQRHALNISVFYGDKHKGIHTFARFYSGQPYTPTLVSGTRTGQNVIAGLATNTRQRPTRFYMDVNAFRQFVFNGIEFEIFLQVYNLLDGKNPLIVWTDTGKPDYTIYMKQAIEADPTWFIRPDYYSEPRKIQLGLKVSL